MFSGQGSHPLLNDTVDLPEGKTLHGAGPFSDLNSRNVNVPSDSNTGILFPTRNISHGSSGSQFCSSGVTPPHAYKVHHFTLPVESAPWVWLDLHSSLSSFKKDASSLELWTLWKRTTKPTMQLQVFGSPVARKVSWISVAFYSYQPLEEYHCISYVHGRVRNQITERSACVLHAYAETFSLCRFSGEVLLGQGYCNLWIPQCKIRSIMWAGSGFTRPRNATYACMRSHVLSLRQRSEIYGFVGSCFCHPKQSFPM